MAYPSDLLEGKCVISKAENEKVGAVEEEEEVDEVEDEEQAMEEEEEEIALSTDDNRAEAERIGMRLGKAITDPVSLHENKS